MGFPKMEVSQKNKERMPCSPVFMGQGSLEKKA